MNKLIEKFKNNLKLFQSDCYMLRLWIEHYWNKKKNDKQFRIWSMYNALEMLDIDIRDMQFSKVDVKETKKKITYTITLGRPGLLIGRHGIQIDSIRNHITVMTHKEVVINVIEHDIWRVY